MSDERFGDPRRFKVTLVVPGTRNFMSHVCTASSSLEAFEMARASCRLDETWALIESRDLSMTSDDDLPGKVVFFDDFIANGLPAEHTIDVSKKIGGTGG